jgi:RNA polymerase sigma factor (sigma-70 family)
LKPRKGYRFSTYLVSPLRWALQSRDRKKEIQTVSTETPIAVDDGDATIGDTITDQDCDPWSADDDREASKILNGALDRLDERSRRVVTDLHGLNGADPKTKKAIADDLGISPERVRQIATAAAKKTGIPELISNRNFS